MSVSDAVKQLERDLLAERQLRRQAESSLDEIRYVLEQYNESSCKAWGRTLAKIGKFVGLEVKS